MSSTNTENKVRTMRIYAAGGAGINVTKVFARGNGVPVPGYAAVRPCYIDTSISNAMSLQDSLFFKIEGDFNEDPIDGSGQIRSTNFEPIIRSVPAILNQYEPGDINVIVHSLSGGSGSVAGPAIAEELIKRGHKVICVFINSTDSMQKLTNAINTLAGYQNMANNHGAPVCGIYLENGRDGTEAEVDAKVAGHITNLSGFFSGQNNGLDSEDLAVLLGYNKITKTQPALTLLSILVDNDEHLHSLPNGHAVLAMASLIQKEQSAEPPIPLAYNTYGIISPEFKQSLGANPPVRLVASVGFYSECLARMSQQKAKLQQSLDAARASTINVDAFSGERHSGSSMII